MNALMSISMSADSSRLVGAFKNGRQAVGNFTSTLLQSTRTFRDFDRMVKNAGKALLVFAGGMALSLGSAAKSAAEFDAAMRNVNTIAQLNNKEFKDLSDQVLAMSTELPQSAKSLADGLYDVESSGFKGAKAVEVLNASARAATAGLSETDVSARAITATLNAYGAAVGDASYVSDVLFQTVNLGVLTFSELAENMGDWVGLAASAGVGFEEAAAGLAAMTLAGLPAAQASTDLSRVMQAFIKPSEAMSQVLKNLGYDSGTAAIQALGFKGTLDAVQESTGGTVEALSNVYDNVNSLEGALALGAQGGKNFAGVFDQLTDRSKVAGSTAKAYEEQSKALTVQIDLFKNSIERAKIEVGQHYLPIIGKVVSTGTNMLSLFNDMPDPIHKTVAYTAGFGTVLAGVAGFLLTSALRTKLYGLALKAMGAHSLGAAISNQGLVRGLSNYLLKLAEFIPNTKGAATMIREFAGALKFAAEAAVVLAPAAFIIMDYIGSSKAARKEAEQWAHTKIEGMDLTDFKNWGDEIQRSKEDFNEWRGKVIDSYDALDKLAQHTAAALPFVASSLQLNTERANQWHDEITRLEEAWGTFTNKTLSSAQTINTKLYEIYGKKPGIDFEITPKMLGGKEPIPGADKLKPLLVDSERLQKIWQEIDPNSVAKLSELYKSLPEPGDAGRGEILSQINEITGALTDQAFEWIVNHGAAQDFETQLKVMHDPILQLIDGTAELTDRQKGLNEAIDSIGTADYAEALSNQTDWLETFREKAEKSHKSAKNFAEDLLAYGAITQPTFDAWMKNIGDTDEKWAEFAGSVHLSLADYASTLEASTQRVENWKTDMLEIASRAATELPDDIAGMATQVTDYLASMGEEGVELAALMADGNDAEFQRMYEAIVGHVKATGDTAGVEMDAAMSIMEVAGRMGGKATARAIGEELGVGADAVEGIMRKYGSNIVDGVNGVLVQMGRQKIQLSAPKANTQRLSGSKRFRAEEGGYLPADATYQPANNGARGLVQWAEAGTEGEWFIPANKRKQDRSVRILADAADHFGYKLSKFAEGGWLTGKDVPKPPQFGHGNLGYGGSAGAEKLYQGTKTWVDENGLGGPAHGNGKGIDPAFMRRFMIYSHMVGGLGITSGWRSKAQQAALYAAWKRGDAGQAPAAPPGSSNHERGMAIDHNPQSTARMRAIAGQLKLWYPMGYEPWHVEPIETRSFDRGGFLEPGYTLAYNGTGSREPVGLPSVSVDLRGANIVGVPDLERTIERAVDKANDKAAVALRKKAQY